MIDQTIRTRKHLEETLARVRFAPSCIGLEKAELCFEVKDAIQPHRTKAGSTNGEPFPDVWKQTTEPLGWLVRLTFTRPDTTTGVVGRGSGRWELIEEGTSVSGAIKTCWLLLELLVRHELMESFEVDGIKVFNPHLTIDELQMPERAKR